MPTKNLNSFFNHWIFLGLIATLALGGALLNAWFGFPFQASLDAIYGTIGGILPYSDSEIYWSGAHRFIDLGYLDAWNMRRPLNTLLLAFYLKITGFNFWYVMAIQMGICAIALTLYLKTLSEDLGILATLLSLIFIYYYAHMYIHTTLTETLGLTLGLLSFVLLWNGWIEKKPITFNAGMASLAMALSVRAGPNFMVCGFLLLILLHPFTHSRFKDLLFSILSFTISFYLFTKLSSFFGNPTGDGLAFSNFGPTLYGLVNGGKRWTFAYEDPHIKNLLMQKSEAQHAVILYKESLRIFISNPLKLFVGMGNYLGAFLIWFVRLLTFGEGLIKIGTTIMSALWWIFIGFKVFQKRLLHYRAYLFLVIVFLSIAASSMIVFKDGGIRTFAVAIPFMGALIGFAFAKLAPLETQQRPQNALAIGGVLFIFLASTMALYIPSRLNTPNISALNLSQEQGQETFLTYNLNKQPHLLIDPSPEIHLRSSPRITLQKGGIYYHSDELLEIDIAKIANGFQNNNLVILIIYDYISHLTKWVLAENHILDTNADWIEIHAKLTANDFKKIYQACSYMELAQK